MPNNYEQYCCDHCGFIYNAYHELICPTCSGPTVFETDYYKPSNRDKYYDLGLRNNTKFDDE